jgi:hypothetical protein
VTCLFPAGIGADIDIVFKIKYPQDLFTEMVDRTCATERDGGCETGEGFSYYPPSISQIIPVPPNAMGQEIEIVGTDFGATASTVNITIGDRQCLDGKLSFDNRYSDATLTCDAQKEVVGRQTVVVSVAEQTAVYDGYFEFLCYENFYAMEGEYCVECPRDPGSARGTYAAECKMGYTNPIAYEGWYYEPLPVVGGQWNDLCGPERMSPLVSPAREDDGCPFVVSCSATMDGDTVLQRCRGGGGGTNTKDFPFVAMSVSSARSNGNELYNHPSLEDTLCQPISSDWRVAKGTQRCLECAQVNFDGNGDDAKCEKCQWQCGPSAEWSIKEEDDRDMSLFFTFGDYGNQCDRKYMGLGCDVCSPNHFKVNNQCDECPANEWLYVLIALFVGSGAGGCAWFLNKYNVNLAILNIMVDFFQGISLFIRADVPWPAAVRNVISLMSALNFNIEILGIECAVDFLYSEKFAIKMIMPVATLGLLLTTYLTTFAIMKLSEKFEWQRTLNVLKHFELFDDACIGAYIIFFYFVYLELTRTALDVFNCEDRVPSDGNSYMVSLRSEVCGEEGGVQSGLVAYGVIGLIVYCIGFPIVLGFMLYTNREAIDLDMEMRALHLTHQRKKADHYPMTLRYARFYKYFKPDCKYWNIVIMGRKFFLAGTALLFRGNATFQLSIALLGMFVAFVLQIHYRPYWSVEEQQQLVKELRHKKNHDNISDDVKEFMALQLQMKKNAEMKEKGALGGPRQSKVNPIENKTETEEYESVLNQNNSIIYNLNTIEAVMLATTVLINLAGIMLSSGQFQDMEREKKYQVNLITYSILLAIGGCAFLLSSALIREIWLAKNIESNMTKAKWRTVVKRQIKINKKKRARVKRFQDVVYQAMQVHNLSTQSVHTLQSSEWVERDDGNGQHAGAFHSFLTLFSGDMKVEHSQSPTGSLKRQGTINERAQHEVELTAQRDVMNKDKEEADARFKEKLEKKKKKRKKKKHAVVPADESGDPLPAEEISPAEVTSTSSGPPLPGPAPAPETERRRVTVLETDLT